LTIAYCDPLDGKTDGVIGRSDLCKIDFNLNSTIGVAYNCAASMGSPAQNGTISSQGVEVASTILAGLHDSDGRQVYVPYQYGADFEDADTTYNSATSEWEASILALGGEWVVKFLELRNASNLDSINNVTYDTIKGWMELGWKTYEDSLQTTWPDLSDFQNVGGKVIHVHGESDPSVPPASSVRYWESVRSVMFPDQSYNESTASLQDFYRLYLVPGGAHCSGNSKQPNGPWPQSTLLELIDWVEKGVVPSTINAIVQQGENEGEVQQLCAWPLRPLWANNGTTMDCVYDQASIDSWHYELDAFDLSVY
jgi:tannase